jgi:hypothetical protein
MRLSHQRRVTTTHRALSCVLHVSLLLVVVAEANTVWIGIADPPRYVAAFPGATGPLFAVMIATSAAAGVNALMIWLRQRWAIWLNLVIGPWSVALIELVGGPRATEVVVLAAWALTTFLPLVVWRRA